VNEVEMVEIDNGHRSCVKKERSHCIIHYNQVAVQWCIYKFMLGGYLTLKAFILTDVMQWRV